MEVATHQEAGVLVVEVPGEHLDASNSQAFKQAVLPQIEAARHVLFDLHEVEFVDSSGLGVILSCLRTVKRNGGELKLCGLSEPVRVLFELVRMQRVFDVLSGREEAVRSFSDA